MNKIPYRNSAEYKAKRNAYAKKYYKNKYSAKQIQNNHKCRRKNRDWLQELKSTLKCNRCPESDADCLDFHHANPNEKEYNIFEMVGHGYGKKTILAEIAKCEVLCANCHRKHHAAERRLA